MKVFRFLLVCLVFSGCASPTPGLGNKSADVEGVVVATDIPPGAVSLKSLSAAACSSSPFDVVPSNKTALIKLQQKALSIGATGLSNVSYGVAGLFDECGILGGRLAHGTAFRAE